jgi:hypothetical protein
LAAKQFPASYVALFDYARLLVLNRKPEASLAILDTLTVLPFEGARYTREVYRQACILSSANAMKDGKYQNASRLLEKARQWPERLGVGKPYEVDDRFEDYLEGMCSVKSGDKVRGQKLFGQVAAYTRTHSGDSGVSRLFGALAERALGKEEAATKLAEEWTKEGKSSLARWLVSTLRGNVTEASAIEKELRGSSSATLLGRSSVDQEFALIMEVYRSVKF